MMQMISQTAENAGGDTNSVSRALNLRLWANGTGQRPLDIVHDDWYYQSYDRTKDSHGSCCPMYAGSLAAEAAH
eukprot:3789-Amphidinium_carterae.1